MPTRILLVDDWPEILMAYRMALSDPHMEIVAVENGQKALDQVHLQQFNLIILDIDMPGMNGFEVCRRLKEDENARDIPIIFITGNVSPATETQAKSMGGVEYLTKPFNLNKLRSTIQRWAIP